MLKCWYVSLLPAGQLEKKIREEPAWAGLPYYLVEPRGVEARPRGRVRGKLRSCHKLFDLLGKWDQDWVRDTLEIKGEWESDLLPEL